MSTNGTDSSTRDDFAARRAALWRERQALMSRVGEIDAEDHELRLTQCRTEHPCHCVRLNRDLKIHTMEQQERCGRKPLMHMGFVSESLSTLGTCPLCHGTGKPR